MRIVVSDIETNGLNDSDKLWICGGKDITTGEISRFDNCHEDEVADLRLEEEKQNYEREHGQAQAAAQFEACEEYHACRNPDAAKQYKSMPQKKEER